MFFQNVLLFPFHLIVHLCWPEVIEKYAVISKFNDWPVNAEYAPPSGLPPKAIIGGDNKVISIAAASIIAKVYRDELMCRLHKAHPLYNFAKHKGYGTAEHCEAIVKHGLSPLHRLTFCSRLLPSP